MPPRLVAIRWIAVRAGFALLKASSAALASCGAVIAIERQGRRRGAARLVRRGRGRLLGLHDDAGDEQGRGQRQDTLEIHETSPP